jgi:hypothetical protein
MKMKKGDIMDTGRINILSEKGRLRPGIIVGVYDGHELLSKAMQIACYLEDPKRLSKGELVRVMWSTGKLSDILSSFIKKI